MARGDQLGRQWKIIQTLISSKLGKSAADLAKDLECHPRTVYRDLEALQVAGFPIYTERVEGKTLWSLLDTVKHQIPIPFSLPELMALYFGSDMMKVFQGTVFYDSLESLFQKVKTTLPPESKKFIKNVEQTLHLGMKPYKQYSKFKEIINRVNDAAIKKKSIEIVYYTMSRKKESKRKVDPYKIWFYEGTIYIIGFCHLRKKIRTFVIDRIKLLRLTDGKFKQPQGFDFDAYTRHSFKVMQDELYTVKVRISPAWAKYVGEKIWHESQIACKMPDKSLELSFRVAGLEEMKQWVMGLGPEAYVIEPEKLKEMVKAGLRKALIQYEGLRLAQRKSDARGNRLHLV